MGTGKQQRALDGLMKEYVSDVHGEKTPEERKKFLADLGLGKASGIPAQLPKDDQSESPEVSGSEGTS